MISYRSNRGGERREEAPQVVCAWCGGVIRRGAAKATKRMCQPCFERMMLEHSRAHQPSSSLSHASER